MGERGDVGGTAPSPPVKGLSSLAFPLKPVVSFVLCFMAGPIVAGRAFLRLLLTKKMAIHGLLFFQYKDKIVDTDADMISIVKRVSYFTLQLLSIERRSMRAAAIIQHIVLLLIFDQSLVP